MAKIFIIAGHGAGDPGAIGNGFQEAERVRALANRIKALGGANVMLGDFNRNYYADNGISNLNISKDYQIIELHMDSAVPSARGGHVIIYGGYQPDKYDTALANFIAGILPGRSQKIVGRTDLANPYRASVKGYSYRLVECGFITNPTDISTFNNRMDEIARGILKSFEITTQENSNPTPPPTTTTNLYRIRKTWDDAKSQVGAYANLDNAKAACPSGYTVFDSNGKAVYTNSVVQKLYRVRKSWTDEKSQTGAYASLDNAKASCAVGYTVYDWNGNAVYTNKPSAPVEPPKEDKPVEKPEQKPDEKPIEYPDISPLKGISHDGFLKTIGEMAHEDMVKTGVLASVTIAQAILESAWGQSELSLKANNLFGMKASLSGNTWKSDWDGKEYEKSSPEEINGEVIQKVSKFRMFASPSASIKDHSDYLNGAMNGTELRYKGLKGETDYRAAITIIKNGGYATDSGYIDKICGLIEQYKLYEYDKIEVEEPEIPVEKPEEPTEKPDNTNNVLEDISNGVSLIAKILKAIYDVIQKIANAFSK